VLHGVSVWQRWKYDGEQRTSGIRWKTYRNVGGHVDVAPWWGVALGKWVVVVVGERGGRRQQSEQAERDLYQTSRGKQIKSQIIQTRKVT
jgi:hypothetical protein